ncbi:hypothetical protein [Stratiformator vulcanicus]|uniref:Uncharacterized protein n=1 Tax=Stratiformator vulcanicus TaxID=2527980 RepID=A0A517R5G2_9PLAN|nr:hypothetical protein [Stratiformator vulcanicus]QDT39112.1 hypothetical protein Pan189_35140 [Stratiformator vulcanicus]
MNTITAPTCESAELPLPRRLMRHLIVSHGVDIGSRMLVTGDFEEPLAEFLNYLHIQTDIDRSGFAANAKEGVYDAVLVLRSGPVIRGDAAGGLRTAELLSQLKPGGCLTIVQHAEVGRGTAEDLADDFHMFPGTCRTSEFRDRRALWGGFAMGSRSVHGYCVATLHIPAEPMTASTWRAHALRHATPGRSAAAA